jgi:hypothetical protein
MLLSVAASWMLAPHGFAGESADVFCGPFSNWMNARTGYNAKGDGTTDDAPALQNALNALVNNTTSRVLFIPAGTYLIKSTLTLTGTKGCSVIGEDPATTIIKWGGAPDGDMFTSTGNMFVRYSRLTFDGASSANHGISYLWNYVGNFQTGLETSDLVLQNMKIGVHAGMVLDASTFIRCRFKNCTIYGIYVDDYNTVDIWARFCLFQNCGTGVAIGNGGEIGIYQSVFKNNTLDINVNTNPWWCSVRDNYSSGAGHFFSGIGEIEIAGNIIDASASTNIIDINRFWSRAHLIDNIIRSPANATGPVVRVGDLGNATGATLLSVNNTFTVTGYDGSNTSITAVRSIGDKSVDRTTLTITEPILPSTPPRFTGTVIEPAAFTGSAIQTAINTAATAYKGQKPVVHLKTGTYTVDSKIVIPATSDLRLVGDVGLLGDNGTRLNWTGNQGDTLLVLRSPARAELKDFYINGGGKVYGIFIDKADQAGARVFLDQLSTNQFTASTQGIGLYVDGLDNAVVEAWHCFPGGLKGAVVSRGGPRSIAGDTATTARVDIFGGNGGFFSTTYPMFDVKDNGRLMVQDLWAENGLTRGLALKLDNTSSGTLTLDGGKHQYHTNTALGGPTHIVNGFKGICMVMDVALYDALITIGGNQPLQNALFLGIAYQPNGGGPTTADPGATYTMDATAGANVVMFGNYWTVATPAPVDVGNPTDAWLLKMLKQTRTEHPSWDIADLPAGVTDARIWRVGLDNCLDAVTIKGGGASARLMRDRSGHSNPSALHSKVSVALPGMRRIALPPNAKQIALFDLQGRTLFASSIGRDGDATRKCSASMRIKSMVVVRTVSGE